MPLHFCYHISVKLLLDADEGGAAMGMGERRFFLAECGSRWDLEESRDGGAKERVDVRLDSRIYVGFTIITTDFVM